MSSKTTATCLLFIGLGAAGVIFAAPQTRPDRTSPRGPRAERTTTSRPAASGRKVQPALQVMKDYVVEPPDLIIVEVLEALPGRPISGERLVRPDGKISLGFYGDIYVAGLTITEVKEKVVQHLRKYLNDDILGLCDLDDRGEPERDEKGKVKIRDLKDTDRVFVDVTAYNSKTYYVQGEVRSPGRIPITGHETVLDAISYAGGLTPRADHDNVILYHTGQDHVVRGMPIDIDQIMMGDDPTTNFQLLPGDRLVIPARRGAAPAEDSPRTRPAGSLSRSAPEDGDRRPGLLAPTARDGLRDLGPARRGAEAEDAPALRDLERRLDQVERKLDRVLEALERRPE